MTKLNNRIKMTIKLSENDYFKCSVFINAEDKCPMPLSHVAPLGFYQVSAAETSTLATSIRCLVPHISLKRMVVLKFKTGTFRIESTKTNAPPRPAQCDARPSADS